MTRLISATLAALVLLSSLDAVAETKYDRRLSSAIEVLEEFTAIPEKAIPANLLSDAYAVAVLPNVVKIGIGIGGRFGSGVLVQRQPDGRWSNPSFVNLGGGSIGLQLGAQSTDIVLVFKSKRSLDKLYNGKMTLGADISVAAGPVGRFTSASTDVTLKTEAYSYSRNRGLFAGVSLEGAVLGIDQDGNELYYGAGDSSARSILNDDSIPTPASARRFQETLASAAAPLQWTPEDGRTARAETAKPAATTEPETRTYGLDDAPASGGEVVF